MSPKYKSIHCKNIALPKLENYRSLHYIQKHQPITVQRPRFMPLKILENLFQVLSARNDLIDFSISPVMI